MRDITGWILWYFFFMILVRGTRFYLRQLLHIFLTFIFWFIIFNQNLYILFLTNNFELENFKISTQTKIIESHGTLLNHLQMWGKKKILYMIKCNTSKKQPIQKTWAYCTRLTTKKKRFLFPHHIYIYMS